MFSYLNYCDSKIPVIITKLGSKGKIFKTVEFSTWSYTSFNWIYDLWWGVCPCPVGENPTLKIKRYSITLIIEIWLVNSLVFMSNSVKTGFVWSTSIILYFRFIFYYVILGIYFNGFSLFLVPPVEIILQPLEWNKAGRGSFSILAKRYTHILPCRQRILAFPLPIVIIRLQCNLQTRKFSSTTTKNSENNNAKLNPWFIAGFTDGEGCFSFILVENKTLHP